MNQHVLIVDDERLIRELLARALAERGHQLELCADGKEALAAIAARPPDLVLLDLMMPHMDGFDVLEKLRADPRTEGLQIIVLTARASQEVLQEALNAGADDYISKPFHLGEVVARVEAHLRIARYARQLDRQRRDNEMLVEISQRLTSRLDIQSILRDVTAHVAELLRTDRCSVVLVEPEGTTGRVVAASDDLGLTDREIALDRYPEIRRVLETREPLVVPDITADPLFDPVKDQLAQLDIRSSALFPMMEGERCIGVLFLRSTQPWASFDERGKQYGSLVANATAIAVSNARLFGKVREETERLQTLIDASPDAIVAADQHGNVTVFNKAAEQLFGRSAADVVARLHVSRLFPDGGAAAVLETLRGEEHGGPGRIVPAIDRAALGADGAAIPVRLSASVVRVGGKDVAAVVVLQDQRDRIEMQTELSRAQEKLAESEKIALLAELAGATAHELNQPLTSVLGYAELLQRRLSPEDPNLKAVQTIEREGRRMAEIVKKIGRITRYETKPYVGRTRIIDLQAAADSAEIDPQ